MNGFAASIGAACRSCGAGPTIELNVGARQAGAGGATGSAPGGTGQLGERQSRFVAEAIIPQQVWELALELVPGIGTVPGVASAGRRALAKTLADEGLPVTARGVRTLVEWVKSNAESQLKHATPRAAGG